MRILILTQNESLYLPRSFARVLEELSGEVVCIVSAPAMSTHKGFVRGIVKHLALFGVINSLIIGARVALYKAFDVLSVGKAFRSIRSVARRYKVPYAEIEKVNSQPFYRIIDQYCPDLLISISCPQIIGERTRDRFAMGCINVHGAPLPRYRGLMPAFWALLNNESKTAVTVHDLADKLDNGKILLQVEVPITPSDSWDSLVRRTKEAGAEALIEAVRQISSGTVRRRDNPDEAATYFSFPTRVDRKAFLAAGRRFL